jgi:hypothetical protein
MATCSFLLRLVMHLIKGRLDFNRIVHIFVCSQKLSHAIQSNGSALRIFMPKYIAVKNIDRFFIY